MENNHQFLNRYHVPDYRTPPSLTVLTETQSFMSLTRKYRARGGCAIRWTIVWMCILIQFYSMFLEHYQENVLFYSLLIFPHSSYIQHPIYHFNWYQKAGDASSSLVWHGQFFSKRQFKTLREHEIFDLSFLSHLIILKQMRWSARHLVSATEYLQLILLSQFVPHSSRLYSTLREDYGTCPLIPNRSSKSYARRNVLSVGDMMSTKPLLKNRERRWWEYYSTLFDMSWKGTYL